MSRLLTTHFQNLFKKKSDLLISRHIVKPIVLQTILQVFSISEQGRLKKVSPIIFASDITSTHQFINYQIMIHRCEKLLVLLMASYLLLVKICWVNLISVDIEFVKQNSNEFVVSAMLPHLMRIYLFQWKSPKKIQISNLAHFFKTHPKNQHLNCNHHHFFWHVH